MNFCVEWRSGEVKRTILDPSREICFQFDKKRGRGTTVVMIVAVAEAEAKAVAVAVAVPIRICH